jgi:hypothetical protein
MRQVFVITVVLGLVLFAVVGALAEVARGRRPRLFGRPVLSAA